MKDRKLVAPRDGELLGDNVPIGVIAKLEHDMALARHGLEQRSGQFRIVARYERGKSHFRIGLPIVGARTDVQQDQRPGGRTGRYVHDRDVVAKGFDVLQEDDVAQRLALQPSHCLAHIVGRVQACHLRSILVNCTEK